MNSRHRYNLPVQLLQQLRRVLRILAPQRTSSNASSEGTPDDVERVVRRDFTAAEYTTVTEILNEYGAEKWHRKPILVRLLALGEANGSVQKLQAFIDWAKQDLRDARSCFVCEGSVGPGDEHTCTVLIQPHVITSEKQIKSPCFMWAHDACVVKLIPLAAFAIALRSETAPKR